MLQQAYDEVNLFAVECVVGEVERMDGGVILQRLLR